MSPTKIADRVLSWASIIDDTTREQAIALAQLPFIEPHIALMPDVHAGMGSAVGTVIPTVKAVIPAAVGVDIGCGMIAARTRHIADDLGRISLEELRDQLERSIPLSPGNYNRKIHLDHTADRIAELEDRAEEDGVDLSHSPKWREQLGSLGGGNHFIELCLDEEDRVWCFLHSGSRGVGNKIARKHIKTAQSLCKKWFVPLADPDHAYLVEGAPEFTQYLKDLAWAQKFAALNRDDMMDRFVDQLARLMGDPAGEVEVERINTHHNYTEKVTIKGKSVWLTRKGAINAEEGRPGLIPGSMGTRSYVTVGKGNASALFSAPHGAGRAMSRREAKRQFTIDDLATQMGGHCLPSRRAVDRRDPHGIQAH